MVLWNFFGKLIKPKHGSMEEILNEGLSLVMEFGVNWLKPINDRLLVKYPFLSEAELSELNSICQNTMKQGHDYVYRILDELINSNNAIGSSQLKKQFDIQIRTEFNWVVDSNLKRLYSQGCYYAYKDGLDKAIK